MTEQPNQEMILIEVAYALPHKQKIVELKVEAGCTAAEAVRRSGMERFFPELDIEKAKLGIFGKALSGKDSPDKHVMAEGERIEIYRPLISDPKEVRKKRAAEAKAKRAAEKS